MDKNDSGDGKKCLTGAKIKCCRRIQDTVLSGECHWIGTSPFCNPGPCTPGWIKVDEKWDANGSKCWTGAKAKCCRAH